MEFQSAALQGITSLPPMSLILQKQILEMIARGDPLRDTAKRMCVEAEILAPDSICSILMVDDGGKLRSLAAPSLPAAFSDAIDGLAVGPSVGSCGTAAYLGQAVAVCDIATDPLWDDFRALALPFGLAACWSSPIFGSDGRVIGTFAFYFPTNRGPTEADQRIVTTCVDLCTIAFERHEAETKIHRLAYFDSLTGLSNRASFTLELESVEGAEEFGLLLIDVDRLKVINDTLGHSAGDDLLRTIGMRLGAVTPGTSYRISGDEFAVIVRGADTSERLSYLAGMILEAMQAPAVCGGRTLQIVITIGGAIREAAETTEEVRHQADVALYHAKETNRGGFVRFAAGLGTEMARRLAAIQAVQDAVREGRVEAHFQPLVHLETSEIIGVEALCRVMDYERVRMPEAEFHLAMSDAATAAQVTDCMLNQVARSVRDWLDAGIPFQHVGVNVAVGDFQGGDLDQRIAGVFDAFNVPLKHIVLEVTEQVYLGKSDLMIAEAVAALRSRGLLVALDDFGTGYASLTHLLTFPVDIIKIDRSFVEGLEAGGASAVIVGGVIDIARKLGMRVVAEGIETEKQAQLLRSLGCRLGQGYYYARPADFSVTTERLLRAAQTGF